MTDEAQARAGCEVTTPPTERPALMGCPLCGSDEISFGLQDFGAGEQHFAACEECGCNTGARDTEAAAITAWNTRHPSPALPTPAPAGLADELRRLLDGVTPRPWREHAECGYVAGSASDYAQLHVPRYSDRALVLALVNNLDTLLAALAAPVPGAGWMPIETAPRDGTPILVAADGVVGEAHFADSDGGWWWAGNDPTDHWGDKIFPTRWMPLPAPPSPAEGAAQ